jgi:hypothetical protein
VDDIILSSSDVRLLLETKRFLFLNFDMKDLGEALFILGIEIHQDRKKGIEIITECIFKKGSKEI